MLEAIIGGLLGAALGLALYHLGRYSLRRERRVTAAERSAPVPETVLTPKELQEFLNYTGYADERTEEKE